jgi:hypothetical protein
MKFLVIEIQTFFFSYKMQILTLKQFGSSLTIYLVCKVFQNLYFIFISVDLLLYSEILCFRKLNFLFSLSILINIVHYNCCYKNAKN